MDATVLFSKHKLICICITSAPVFRQGSNHHLQQQGVEEIPDANTLKSCPHTQHPHTTNAPLDSELIPCTTPNYTPSNMCSPFRISPPLVSIKDDYSLMTDGNIQTDLREF